MHCYYHLLDEGLLTLYSNFCQAIRIDDGVLFETAGQHGRVG